MSADVLRDSFLRFMADGMNYDEALREFDEEEFTKAAFAELVDGEAVRSVTMFGKVPVAGEFITNDSRQLPALFQLLSRAQFERSNAADSPAYQQALDLWGEGWTSENQPPAGAGFWSQPQVMSWYWRRPPRRKGTKGKLFLSTNQAWLAMRREKGLPTTTP